MPQPLCGAHPRLCLSCQVLETVFLTGEIFRLDFSWRGPAPRAGQFFMIKPERNSLFLARPISAARWEPANSADPEELRLSFLVALRGRGTAELSRMRPGEGAELTGPLGKPWAAFFAEPAGGAGKPAAKESKVRKSAESEAGKPWALVGGGVGIAPLLALAEELAGNKTTPKNPGHSREFDFYGGFKKNLDPQSLAALIGPVPGARRVCLAFEEPEESGDPGGAPEKPPVPVIYRGRIPDFVNPGDYSAVYACGPGPMLASLAERCGTAAVPCYVSLERRMACGVGACLGCTVETRSGHRRCCADGPVFSAEELYFDR